MEINNNSQQQIEHNEIELLDQNTINLIMDLPDNSNQSTLQEDVTEKIDEHSATEPICHDNELVKHSEEIINVITDNNDTTENVNVKPDNIEMKTDSFSEQEDNSTINTKILDKISTEFTSITENLIGQQNSESVDETTKLEKTENTWGYKTVTVIENITIVPSTENEKIPEKINNEENCIEIQSDNEIMENEKCPESSSKDCTSGNTFLPEATVANYLKNSGLSFLQSQYGTDDSDEDDDEDDDCIVELSTEELNAKEYRDNIIVNSSDSEDSDVEYLNTTEQQQKNIIDLDELIDDDDDDEQQNNKYKGPIRVKGELLLDDLPPIQDLKITVPETECVELGKIHSIVDQLVLVDSIPGTVPLDLDTILFMDKGKTVLGEVFDVLGQIKSPLYCVRFNSNKQIKEKGINIGQIVFVAPRTEHTQFIILDNLMRIRGSDASWENDIEPNDKHREFSDDEEEVNFRKKLHNKNRPNDHNDLTKRSRTASTSSSMYSDADLNENIESNFHNNQQNNYGGNSNYRGNRRGGYQPRQRGGGGRGRQNHYQNVPRFNYDNSGGSSWHSNYNNNQRNDYYPHHQHQQNLYQQHSQPRYQLPSPQQQQQQQQSSTVLQSNLYPNPYAVRPPYIPPNVMQQPLFPPQPSASQMGQQSSLNYPPQ